MSMSTISTMSHPPCPRPHFGQVMFYFQIVLTLSFFCVRFSTFQYFTLFNIVVDLCWLCPFFVFVLAFLCILLDLCWFCQFFVQALTFTYTSCNIIVDGFQSVHCILKKPSSLSGSGPFHWADGEAEHKDGIQRGEAGGWQCCDPAPGEQLSWKF